jgi:F0F1-type ATP synthase assembly protein I
MAAPQSKVKEKPVMAQVAHYLGLATILPACVFVGWLMGYGLDRWLGTSFFQVVFLILGVVSGFVQLIRDLMRDTGQN